MKDKIKQILKDRIWNNAKNDMAGFYETELLDLVNDVVNDLGLSNEWVSVDDENDYPQLMKGGTLTFWHKVHKCEVTGFIVKNEPEDKIIQGQYSVIEQTKTTKWPMESFSFVRAPSLPPKEGGE
jgi:hypothetical protein